MPDFSRDPVEIPEEGKLVVALQDGTDKDDDKDYVWLTAVGIYEQVTVSDSKDEAKNNFAATSTTASEEQKTAAQQIANNITFSDGGEDYKVTATTTDNGATWTYEVKTEAGATTTAFTAVESGNTVAVTDVSTSQTVETKEENGVTSEEKAALKEETVSSFTFNLPETLSVGVGEMLELDYKDGLVWEIEDDSIVALSGAYLFANDLGTTNITANGKSCEVTVTKFHGGDGTSDNPFEIINVTQFNNIGYKDAWSVSSDHISYYRLLDDISLTTNRWYDRYVYSINFDLNNHTIYASSGSIFCYVSYINIHNGSFNLSNGANVLYDYASDDATLVVENISLVGNVSTSDQFYGPLGSYIGNAANKAQTTQVSINNVNSTVNIKSTHNVGGLLGYCRNIHLDMSNCTVSGRIEAAQNSGGFVAGEQYQTVGCDNTLNRGIGTISNCKFNGTLILPTNQTGYYCGPNFTNDAQYKGATGQIFNTIDISNDIVIDSEFGSEIKVNYTSVDYKKIIIEFAFNVDSTVYNAGGYPRTISKEFNCSSLSVNDIIETGLYKFYIQDGTYSEGDVRTAENSPIFTRSGYQVYFFDGNGSYEVSNGTVSIKIFAYNSSDELVAVGSACYSGAQQ